MKINEVCTKYGNFFTVRRISCWLTRKKRTDESLRRLDLSAEIRFTFTVVLKQTKSICFKAIPPLFRFSYVRYLFVFFFNKNFMSNKLEKRLQFSFQVSKRGQFTNVLRLRK